MNTKTGAIRPFTNEEIKAGLHDALGHDLPLSDEDVARLRHVSPQDRVAWAKQRVAERHEGKRRASTFMPSPKAGFKRRPARG